MKNYTYLLIDLVVIIIPLIASFYKKRPFFREWKYFIPANLIVAIAFLIWDHFFTLSGIWGFNPDYLISYNIGALPIEEILFFIAIPYACVFTYFAIEYLIPHNPIRKVHKYFTWILIIGFSLVLIFNYDKAYTGLTLILSIAYLLTAIFFRLDLSYHYLTYLLILPFFFLSNGVLTGSFLDQAIVSYNDTENLGIRLFTIPIEDSIYGFLLISLNISLYNYFKKRIGQ